LVRDAQSRLGGILVVPSDSPIRDIHQLEGKTVAFPAPNAYVASLLMRALLAREKIHIGADYVGSHGNVFRAAALGAADAGGGANTTLEHEPTALRSQLRMLYTSSLYMSHPFAAHPRVPRQIREKVIVGFLALDGYAEGRAMLEVIQMDQPVRADYEHDYRGLESLGLVHFVEVARP